MTAPVPARLISTELSLPERGVAAVLELITSGATVPFIARYRKEATGGLDEVQIRAIGERHEYLADLDTRRRAVLASIEEQGKLTPALRAEIEAATTKAALEDLYLPFRPKRRTRAATAREKGLGPLADRILLQPADGDPEREAAAFVDPSKKVGSAEDALAGARDIAAEAVAERPAVRSVVRRAFEETGLVTSERARSAPEGPTKYEQYYSFKESVRTIPSHRYLAIRRGEAEGVLTGGVEIDREQILPRIGGVVGLSRRSPFARHLVMAIMDGFDRLLAPSLENEIRAELKARSDRAAVEVFAENLRNLLLAAPLGAKSVIGIDPGIRTGAKCAAIGATGKFLENVTIYPGQGEAKTARAKADLAALIKKHRPHAIAVGNGTAGRETLAFVKEVLADEDLAKDVFVTLVSEAGASVYSASDLAREEHPDLDVTVRGAISIARRLQDPLAELVKIEPRAIGVGQYQHDVHQPLLDKKLDEVVESCVNHVGADLNTASAPLLSRVAGIGPKLARRIVEHREAEGSFAERRALLEVSGLGPRAFEQCAGFLRIRGGRNPLDASAVHPERYDLVERIARDLGVSLPALVGDAGLARRIDLSRYTTKDVGEPTLRDIIRELEKPGRDPRASFEPPRFREDVSKIEDLAPGMELEGVVTNVVAFGAFVDIGVHRDGLVHTSQLADHYVREPSEVVKVGDRLKVRVLEVDLARNRISLTARSAAKAPPHQKDHSGRPPGA